MMVFVSFQRKKLAPINYCFLINNPYLAAGLLFKTMDFQSYFLPSVAISIFCPPLLSPWVNAIFQLNQFILLIRMSLCIKRRQLLHYWRIQLSEGHSTKQICWKWCDFYIACPFVRVVCAWKSESWKTKWSSKVKVDIIENASSSHVYKTWSFRGRHNTSKAVSFYISRESN